MIFDLNNLPTETSDLHKIVCVLARENQLLLNSNVLLNDSNAFLSNNNHCLISEVALLKEQLALLRAKHFGKSSEKIKQTIKNAELQIEDKEISLGLRDQNEQSTGAKQSTKQKPRRKKMPKHIPTEEIVLKPDNACLNCGGEKFRKIDDDISEVLEYVPSSFKVIRYIRPRCVCKSCENIVQAYPASKAIDKGKAGFGLLAHVLVQKYCNHLPLYRQSEMYNREGIDISRTTMASWVGKCAKLLDPIVEEIKKAVFTADQIHADDTPIRVLDDVPRKTRIGRIWTYVRDGRPHGDNSPPAVCYFYSPDRKGTRPAEHLRNFKGIIHTDAYAGYNSSNVDRAGCWAHMRRKFYEVTIISENATIAQETLDQISKIYDVESEIRGSDPEIRLQTRYEKSKNLVEDLFNGFKKVHKKLPPKGGTARAIAYALNNEEHLKLFLTNGKIEIDNNTAERSLRSVAVGRKNWLFAGSNDGGRTAANIYSIIETAKLNSINPWMYLRKVLSVIQDYNSQKIADLLPWNITLE